MTPALFAQSLLAALSLPTSDNNVAALVAIQKQEGGHEANSAWFNPLNTMRDMPGARDAGLQIKGIKAYSSWDEGIAATAKTLAQTAPGFDMRSIVNALRRSAPPEETLAAFAASPWGWYKYVDKKRVPISPDAAIALLKSPAALAKYANTAYRDAGGIASKILPGAMAWWPAMPGGLPVWTSVVFVAATGILGTQLARRRSGLGFVLGAAAGLGGWYVMSSSIAQRGA
jgi:hypothetical protein